SNIRSGFILNQLGYNLSQKDLGDSTVLKERINVKGSTQTAQAFFQWNYKVTPKLTTNVGLHYFHLLLNNSNSVEPRASLKYELTQKNIFTIGYGLHSQLQPIGVYFAKKQNDDNTFSTPNKNLQLSKAQHLVLGYDRVINDFSHIKTEVYYQHLFNVPVSVDKTSTYSMLNEVDGYNTDQLTNKGLGKNYGLELTYERFLHKNLYYILSTSLYNSEYKAANNVWYNTRFNTNYAVTFTAGKEWILSEKRKNRVIGFNIKSIYVGGYRYTPIDLPASLAAGQTKFNTEKTFENKNPDYYRLDIRISVKRNYKHVTSTLALDIQNTTNRKNVGGQYFDLKTGSVKYWYQTPLLPLLSYRLEF
ncbi:MAG: TonB-dependent receptor, partial [Bacteroidota bacterium]|nr:TonB-dependent receptor [Bacteroidota bacterium]